MGDDARERRLADPPSGRVDDPREGDHVGRVDQGDEVGHGVLDLGALVELRPADDLVADLVADQPILQHPRLRVGPVEDRDLLARDALVDEPLDLAGHEPRLGVLVVELADLDRIALAELGEQRLALAAPVVGDHRVGDVEDDLRRAVVLLEADQFGVDEVVLEVQDVLDVGGTERVDRLIVVPDDREVAVPLVGIVARPLSDE